MDKQILNEGNKLTSFAKSRVWLFGIALFLLGAIERTVSFLSGRTLSVMDGVQLLMIVLFLLAWLSLKPEQDLGSNQDS